MLKVRIFTAESDKVDAKVAENPVYGYISDIDKAVKYVYQVSYIAFAILFYDSRKSG